MKISTDLGFVQTKAKADNWEKKFCSIVKKRSAAAIDALDDSEGYRIGYNNESWNVGSKGSYDFTGDRLSSETDLPKLLTVFGLVNEELAATGEFDLITGLPIQEFNAYREPMKRKLMGQRFDYIFNGKPYSSKINAVTIIPQSAGAYFDLILTEDGEVSGNLLSGENVVVIDIGGRTTDVCIMEESRYSQESFTVFTAVWKIHSELARLIMKEYRLTLKPYEIDEITRAGALKLGKDVIPIENLVKQATALNFLELRDEIGLHIADFRRYSAVLLTGGGAYLYNDYFKDLFEKINVPLQVMDNAEFSNVKGYYKYGLLVGSGR